mmetsp:Transcript_2611/g.7802  ORF Transcript_2611/g.7802 Transcript_2611/m.7802 type:complete len:223 (-) Transcript_2611:450-1118(-)
MPAALRARCCSRHVVSNHMIVNRVLVRAFTNVATGMIQTCTRWRRCGASLHTQFQFVAWKFVRVPAGSWRASHCRFKRGESRATCNASNIRLVLTKDCRVHVREHVKLTQRGIRGEKFLLRRAPFHTRTLSVGASFVPRPGVPEEKLRNQMQVRTTWTSVVSSDTKQNVILLDTRVLHNNVEVSVTVENTSVEQFVLRIRGTPLPVFVDEVIIRKGRLRILV